VRSEPRIALSNALHCACCIEPVCKQSSFSAACLGLKDPPTFNLCCASLSSTLHCRDQTSPVLLNPFSTPPVTHSFTHSLTVNKNIMRVFTLLAALATLGAAKVVPSPKITSANAAPDHAQTSPEITPAPTHPPYSDRLEAYRELLKRSANATPAIKKRSEGPCPVDCGNGFCCPLDQKCFTEKDSNDQVSMLCGYP
jgi:hypothetical protein